MIFPGRNERKLRSFRKLLPHINDIQKAMTSLKKHEMRMKIMEIKHEISSIEDDKKRVKALNKLLPYIFGMVKEVARRVLQMPHYDVQILGGMGLHHGMITEMKTGEGKTLAATLPAFLNALAGRGVHIVTVNDYLAARDAKWMGAIYEYLGLTVKCIQAGMDEKERKEAYRADITYGTNNEFGFDYLRDNLRVNQEEMVQRPFHYAIVDEVDSILIDEARTPLIISGPAQLDTDLYKKVNTIIPKLKKIDYELDEKHKSVSLNDAGISHVEKLLQSAKLIDPKGELYDVQNMHVVHHVDQALKAHHLFEKDVDYIVKEGQVMLVDEFTGRIMEGRRYSDGLHQAIEAKENVEIQKENQTLASITYQNYFRLYPRLAGMTGTAATEAAEFEDIYKLSVLTINTHHPTIRKDEDDVIYQTIEEKYEEMVKYIQELHEKGQPILVGTVSIEKSELLSKLLKKAKIKHQVLNARYHEQEASIIGQAGRWKAVTIATNMAGRGTDIKLGGNLEMMLEEKIKPLKDPTEEKIEKIKEELEKTLSEEKKKVIEAGGLAIIGTERHESRRIDNQLRGRSGRQGDPGMSIFFLSLQDDLMRIFGSDKLSGFMKTLGVQRGEAIAHPWISKSLEKAQQRVEAQNYEARKNILKFDDVVNEQRKVIYRERHSIIRTEEMDEVVKDIIHSTNALLVEKYCDKNQADYTEWGFDILCKEVKITYNAADLDIKKNRRWGVSR